MNAVDCLGNFVYKGDLLSANKDPSLPATMEVKAILGKTVIIAPSSPLDFSFKQITLDSFTKSSWVRSNNQERV